MKKKINLPQKHNKNSTSYPQLGETDPKINELKEKLAKAERENMIIRKIIKLCHQIQEQKDGEKDQAELNRIENVISKL